MHGLSKKIWIYKYENTFQQKVLKCCHKLYGINFSSIPPESLYQGSCATAINPIPVAVVLFTWWFVWLLQTLYVLCENHHLINSPDTTSWRQDWNSSHQTSGPQGRSQTNRFEIDWPLDNNRWSDHRLDFQCIIWKCKLMNFSWHFSNKFWHQKCWTLFELVLR